MSIKKTFLAIAMCCCTATAVAQYIPVQPNPYGERPIIVPVPTTMAGVSDNVKTINDWYILENTDDESICKDISISAAFKPFTLEKTSWSHRTPNQVNIFKQIVTIPEKYAGNRVILRFNGTTHATELFVNGKFVRKHWGSYGSWTADVTGFVTPGQKATIALRMDQRSIGLAAFVRFSGNIYEDSQMYCVPQNHIQRMRIHTQFDSEYKNATLQLWLKTPQKGNGSVRITIADNKGKKLSVSPSVVKLPSEMDEFKYDVTVKGPKKWDAEHPNLYKMTLSLLDDKGKVTETIVRNIGFRNLERRGNQIFVNGEEVKFRGIWGPDDAKQMRDLNINHVRHKYMTEKILDSCDVYGIYVLHENSVDFAKFNNGQSEKYAWQWHDLLADMMERDYNHPSVVMWGLGNESFNDDFTLSTHKYAKFDDPDRQTMFSWANRIKPDEEIPYDVYSYHYAPMADPDLDLSSYGVAIWHSPSLLLERKDNPKMPVIIDEASHVVISREEDSRDPNVRNFWGESIMHSWEKCWNTVGSLGLDQFGMFADMPNWDMPEQWLMRKAYSPFVIKRRIYDNPGTGNPLMIEVENRFCHTNLSEITIEWKVGETTGSVKGPAAAPRQTGSFSIPYKNFKDGDIVELAIKRADGYQVDEYKLEVAPEPFKLPALSASAPALEQDDEYIDVKGKDFELRFDKLAGQIMYMKYKGETIITGGPHLQFLRSNLSIGEYWPSKVTAKVEGSEAVISIDATYSPIAASFEIRIDGNGLMAVNYTIKDFPDPAPHKTRLPWQNADMGGYTEIGIVFTLSKEVDRIEWDRRGLWSTYPDTHVGREKGVAHKIEADQTHWKNLNYDFGWMGGNMSQSTVSNDFRSSKEFIRTANVLLEGKTIGIQALSEEKDAVRLSADRGGGISMYINNEWNYPLLGVGNWMRPAIIIEKGYTNTVHLRPIDVK